MKQILIPTLFSYLCLFQFTFEVYSYTHIFSLNCLNIEENDPLSQYPRSRAE